MKNFDINTHTLLSNFQTNMIEYIMSDAASPEDVALDIISLASDLKHLVNSNTRTVHNKYLQLFKDGFTSQLLDPDIMDAIERTKDVNEITLTLVDDTGAIGVIPGRDLVW